MAVKIKTVVLVLWLCCVADNNHPLIHSLTQHQWLKGLPNAAQLSQSTWLQESPTDLHAVTIQMTTGINNWPTHCHNPDDYRYHLLIITCHNSDDYRYHLLTHIILRWCQAYTYINKFWCIVHLFIIAKVYEVRPSKHSFVFIHSFYYMTLPNTWVFEELSLFITQHGFILSAVIRFSSKHTTRRR